MTQLYFIVVMIFTIVFARVAEKKNSKLLVLVPILILSLFSGLRGIYVGIDTHAYYNAFCNNFPISWQFEEIGFRFISMKLMTIFGNPTTIMLIYSIIINSCIILRLWDFREKCNFSFMIFLYLCIFYIETMNIMRQFISISIIFYCTRYLEQKKYILFCFIVLLTTLIHQASLLAILIAVIYIWKNLSKKNKIMILVPAILIGIIGIRIVIHYERNHISNYFSSENLVNNINITFIYRVCIFFIAFLLNKSNKRIVYKKNNSLNNFIVLNSNEFYIITLIYVTGLAFSSMGMFYFVMARFGYFYLIFELIYWGYLTKKNKNNLLNCMMILIYAVYILGIEFIKNGSRIFPYYINI